jgi:hypothetical protein
MSATSSSQPDGQGELPPLFRVTAISFDFREEVEAVTALAGGPCLSFIRAEAPGIQVPDGAAVLVTLPIDDVMHVFHAAGQVTGPDPRYDGSHPVWTSLNWVYCSLLDSDLGATPMTITAISSSVIVQDPHRPADLFHAAFRAAGGDQDGTVHDFGDIRMTRAQCPDAAVSLHEPAALDRDGRTTALYPQEEERPRPDGYGLVLFNTGVSGDADHLWRRHADIVGNLARWLDGRGLRWSWQYEDGPWLSEVPAGRPAAAGELPALDRRTARTAAAPGPGADWVPLIAATGAFDPENDAALLAWMAGEAGGMTGYAEGVAAAYETAVVSIGLDPVAVEALHECAEAAAFAAEQMAAARQRFAGHYAEVRQFAAGGGVLPFNGRWMTGEGS